jgi:hypothetical protein
MSQSKLSVLNDEGGFHDIVLHAMGDFTDVKTLVAMHRCSKQTKLMIAPLLEKKKLNAKVMRQAVLLTFPSIKDLPEIDPDHGADYFKGLLARYFLTPARPKLHISLSVGSILSLISCGEDKAYSYLKDEMYSSLGRRRVLECISEWRQEPDPNSVHPSTKLLIIENLVRSDFAVPDDRIDSRFGPRRRVDSDDESMPGDSDEADDAEGAMEL